MTLDVAIVTWLPEGIRRVAAMNLPAVEGVRYIVSWQEYGAEADIPAELRDREDLEVHLFDGRGVSANRNNAIRHCTADIILNGDDDLSYTPDELKAVIKTFEKNPEVHVATFAYHGSVKRYPTEKTVLGFPLPKHYSVGAIEIAYRRECSRQLMFDELYGPGAPVWQGAEDEKFLYDARRMGLNCTFFPIKITTHHGGASTGARPLLTKGAAAASGRIIRLEFPASWPLRILLKSLRQWRMGACFLFTLHHQWRGAISGGKA
ncbi:MAG: glycosyltransferase [Firmicutes bacterium]|nr:glycosyltransferase [Bacillota bacterium]MCM1401328.1 glycosyltransferase [Bacteroides sp.]MCM1477281.1 glycosyltransferase [Bacteroides sp.]